MTTKRNFLRCLLIAFLFAAVWPAGAQQFVLSSNRWLIVVDTSASMESRQGATLDSVGAMLLSSMNGQLRPGDTIGMWTFNSTLTRGRFPLQLWHQEVNQSIAASAVQFLKTVKYEKSADFGCVMPEINRLVTNSDILTVILVTDGGAPLKGTPFDESINSTFKKDYRTQKKAKAPFIVAFRSEAGQMTAFTLTPAPWLATFPPLPPAPVYVAPVPPPPAPAIAPAPAPPAPVVPSIILSGKKNESTNVTAETSSSVDGQAPITLTSPSVVTLATEPATINTQSLATVVETQAVENASADTNIPLPETVATQAPPQMPETPTAPTVETPPTPELPAPAVAASTDQPAVTEPTSGETSHTEEMTAASPSAKPTSPSTQNPPSAAPEVATTSAAGSGSQTKLFLGIGLVVIALGIGVLLMRKSRPPSSGSLITRSLDKDKNNP